MSAKLRKVKLYGELGKKFGRTHHFAVASPGEAIRALCANFPEFEAHLSSAHKRRIGYRIIVGDKNGLEAVEQLHDPVGRGSISIVPDVIGSKNGGLGQILMGAVLIWASVMTGGAAAGTLAAQMSPMLMSAGISMALGGVIQMLSPQPKMAEQREERKPSYVMDGTVNTMAQGHPVPVGYGRMIVGSAVISAGMSVYQIGTDDESSENEVGNGTHQAPTTVNPVTGETTPVPPPSVWFNTYEGRWEDMSCQPLIFDPALTYKYRTVDAGQLVYNTPNGRWEVSSPKYLATWDSTVGAWKTLAVNKTSILVLQKTLAWNAEQARFESSYRAQDFATPSTGIY